MASYADFFTVNTFGLPLVRRFLIYTHRGSHVKILFSTLHKQIHLLPRNLRSISVRVRLHSHSSPAAMTIELLCNTQFPFQNQNIFLTRISLPVLSTYFLADWSSPVAGWCSIPNTVFFSVSSKKPERQQKGTRTCLRGGSAPTASTSSKHDKWWRHSLRHVVRTKMV